MADGGGLLRLLGRVSVLVGSNPTPSALRSARPKPLVIRLGVEARAMPGALRAVERTGTGRVPAVS